MLVSLATAPARPDRDNEDFASVTADTLILLDGAGTPDGSESGCIHGVAWFARQLGAQFLAESVKEPRRPLSLCLSRAIRYVRDSHKNTCDLAHLGTPSSTVIAVRLDADCAEYLVLALVGHKDQTTTETVYRHQIRPVVLTGAEAMDRIFPEG